MGDWWNSHVIGYPAIRVVVHAGKGALIMDAKNKGCVKCGKIPKESEAKLFQGLCNDCFMEGQHRDWLFGWGW